MKNEFFKFSSRRILFSTVMASALLAGSPQAVFAEVNELQSVMQAGTVKGQVVDAAGEPVIGATVQVKGTTNGTITDFDGNFALNVSKNAVLVVSFVGYKNEEIPVAGKSSLKITLKEDSKALEEVVVIGYGTQRKGDVTSSVASVKADNFVKGAVKDVGQLIQGKVAGLAITNPNGDPTGSTQIRLRGTNTIGGANTAPLVLIDGIPGLSLIHI